MPNPDEAREQAWRKWCEQQGPMGWAAYRGDQIRRPVFRAGWDAAKRADQERIAALVDGLEDVSSLIGGWRELIAVLDDMPKDEAVGKAMWSALDQIDTTKAALRALGQPEEAESA